MSYSVSIDLKTENNVSVVWLKIMAYRSVLSKKVALTDAKGTVVTLSGEKDLVKRFLMGLPGVDHDSI